MRMGNVSRSIRNSYNRNTRFPLKSWSGSSMIAVTPETKYPYSKVMLFANNRVRHIVQRTKALVPRRQV